MVSLTNREKEQQDINASTALPGSGGAGEMRGTYGCLDSSGVDEDFWRGDDEHVSKAVYALWRWSQWREMPSHSIALFREAAANQIRPTPGGGPPHNNIWFANDSHLRFEAGSS